MPVVTLIGGQNDRPFSVPFSGHKVNKLGDNFERLFKEEHHTVTTVPDTISAATNISKNNYETLRFISPPISNIENIDSGNALLPKHLIEFVDVGKNYTAPINLGGHIEETHDITALNIAFSDYHNHHNNFIITPTHDSIGGLPHDFHITKDKNL